MFKRKPRKRKDRQSSRTWDYSLLAGQKILGHLRDLPNNKKQKGIFIYEEALEMPEWLRNYFHIDLKKAVSDWMILELEVIPKEKKRKKDLYPLRIKPNSMCPVSEVIKPENLSQEVWSCLKEWLGSFEGELFAYGEQWFVLHGRLDALQDEIQRKWQEELEEESRQKKSAFEKERFILKQEGLLPKKEELELSPDEAVAEIETQPAPLAEEEARLQEERKGLQEEDIRLEELQAILKREEEEFKREREEFEEQKEKTIARLEIQQASLAQQEEDLEGKQQAVKDERLRLEKEQTSLKQAQEALKGKQEEFGRWQSTEQASLDEELFILECKEIIIINKGLRLEKEQTSLKQAQEALKGKQEEFAQSQSAHQTSLAQQQVSLERKQQAVEDQRFRLEKEQASLKQAQEALKGKQEEFAQSQSAHQTSLAQQQVEGKQQAVKDQRLRLEKEQTSLKQAQEALKGKQEEFAQSQSAHETSLAQEQESLQQKQEEFALWQSNQRARLEEFQARLTRRQEELNEKEQKFEEEEMLLEVDKEKLTDQAKKLKKTIESYEERQDELEYLDALREKANYEQNELALRAQILEQKEKELSRRSHQLSQQLQRWGLLDTDAPSETTVEVQPADFKSEHELFTHVERYVHSQGFYFPPEVLANFYTCLKTRALVILAGLSGTGKSSLVRLFAEAIDATFLSLSVKATWRDDADLLGFYHPEQKYYIPTPFLDFFVQAEANPERLFIICLDEMNLSRVESYFSEFLSVLEQNEEHRKLRLYSKYEWDSRWREVKNKRGRMGEKGGESSQLDEQERNLRRYPYEIRIPPNLFFCGTVNVDETTYPFSDKVLDRAQIIQFEHVQFSKSYRLAMPLIPKRRLSFQMFEEYCHLEANIELSIHDIHDQWFDELNQILRKGGFHFGYRVKRQMEEYCAYAKLSQIFTNHHAEKGSFVVDLQITQKILPKIQGIKTPRIKNMLLTLREFCSTRHYRQATDKIMRMEQMDPINYWEVFRYGD